LNGPVISQLLPAEAARISPAGRLLLRRTGMALRKAWRDGCEQADGNDGDVLHERLPGFAECNRFKAQAFPAEPAKDQDFFRRAPGRAVSSEQPRRRPPEPARKLPLQKVYINLPDDLPDAAKVPEAPLGSTMV